ncbi:MAG: hypothetical protein Q6356_003290 [Candidatus Wukongarchaeota archaeon]|nr:hypothetical protein [Candidatus Wukongarchaeota archaeon]
MKEASSLGLTFFILLAIVLFPTFVNQLNTTLNVAVPVENAIFIMSSIAYVLSVFFAVAILLSELFKGVHF